MKREGDLLAPPGQNKPVGEGLKKGSTMDVVKEPKKNNNIRELRNTK